MRRSIRFAAVVLVCAACSHEPRPDSPSSPARGQVITAQEIADSQSHTAYEAILKLRANFLSNRGKTTILGNSSSLPTVYLDGQMYGDASTLKNISANVVASIRLYRAWEATTKFGASNMGGVIEVITKTQ